ncbi:MAG: type II secretion system protein GspJ [Candidatus Tectimicrobiota bacterium]
MRMFVHNSRGVTLIELMGAIVVSTLLLSGAWRLLQTGMRSYQKGLQEVQVTQGARTFLTMVTRDIQRAMAARLPYGIHGLPAQGAEAPQADHLEILITPPLSSSSQPGSPSTQGSQRLRYLFTPAPAGQVMTVQRASTPAGQQDAGERLLLVHERLREFSLRYFDGQQWRNEWQQADIPRALEIAVSVQGLGPHPRAYRFTTLITAD